MLQWSKNSSLGESIVDVVLSLDQQAQKLYNQKIALASYSDVKATLIDFRQIDNKIDEIEKEIKTLEGHPGEYLRAMVNSFRYLGYSLQGENIPYSKLIKEIQELPSDLISEKKLNELKDIIGHKLERLGYKGSLIDKSNNWLNDTTLTSEEVIEVAERYIAQSKKATLERIVNLPNEEGIDSINGIRGVFWSGFSKYVGDYRGTLTFNLDRPWRKPIFIQVLTHEAYPGHQTFYSRWDYLFRQGKLPIEASYYLTNSPTNALFEGGPETALHFLGWDSEDEEIDGIAKEDRLQFSLARNYLDMQRIVQTNACYLVNSKELTKDDGIKYMKDLGMMNNIEAENSCRFFTDPIQKTYYPSYYHGRNMIWQAYDLIPSAQRNEFFKILYDTPHTTSTFIKAISKFTLTDFNPFL